MYLTKITQISDEKSLWSHQNGDNNFLRKFADDFSSSQIQGICAQFIKERLRRDGVLTRKVSSLIDVLPNAQLRHMQNILLIFKRMSVELERLQPRTFSNVSLAVPEAAPVMVATIGKSLFKHNDVTWGKIISFLTISGAIAADCAKVGEYGVIQAIIDSASSTIIDEAGLWIDREGGLSALSDHIRPIGSCHITFLGFLTLMVGFLLFLHWAWVGFKALSNQILNIL